MSCSYIDSAEGGGGGRGAGGIKDDIGCHVYFDSVEREERDCGRMKDDFGCLILILILGKGSSGKIIDDFVCCSYFGSVKGEEWEDETQLRLSFLF